MAYNSLACTLCFSPPCSAVTLPFPSYLPGSHLRPPAFPGSPRHPASLNRVQAGSAWGCGGGLVSLCLFCCGQVRLGECGRLPFLASIRLVNSCHAVSFSCVLVPLARAPVCISLSMVCLDLGSQSNFKKTNSQVDKSLRKGCASSPSPRP